MPLHSDPNIDVITRQCRLYEREMKIKKDELYKLKNLLKDEFTEKEELISKNLESVKQLNEFSNVILTIDDKFIENNF